MSIRPAGLEPATCGSVDRQDQTVTGDKPTLMPIGKNECPLCCPTSTPDSDLQRLVELWPSLTRKHRQVVMYEIRQRGPKIT